MPDTPKTTDATAAQARPDRPVSVVTLRTYRPPKGSALRARRSLTLAPEVAAKAITSGHVCPDDRKDGESIDALMDRHCKPVRRDDSKTVRPPAIVPPTPEVVLTSKTQVTPSRRSGAKTPTNGAKPGTEENN